MDLRTDSVNDILEHYGVKHRSGRYPWGSGKRPYQNSEKSSGTVYPAVDKRNGNVFKYDIMSDIELYWAAKEVKITSVYNAPIGGNSKWD